MRRNSRVVILAAILALVTLMVAPAVTPRKLVFAEAHHFVPPDVITAGEIPYPPNSIASGIVTLSINREAMGQVQDVRVLRDIPLLTDPAV
jgi:hypothetical protein